MKTRFARRIDRRGSFYESRPASRRARLSAAPRRLSCEPLEDRRLLSVTPFPVPLEAEDPLGSLIYDASEQASIAVPGETDSYTVDLDDGQTVTVVVDPAATLVPTIELLDPGNNSIGSAAAGASGEDAVLQVVPTAGAGTYTINAGGGRISPGDSGTIGAYTAELILGAAVEDESHDGSSNDTSASAQDLDATFLPLGGGAADRGAVRGAGESAGGLIAGVSTLPGYVSMSGSLGSHSVGVTADLQAWANGETNLGWAIFPTGNNGVEMYSFEHGIPTERPQLSLNVPGGPTTITTGIDTFVRSGPAFVNSSYGTSPVVQWDGSDGGGENIGLIWFDVPRATLDAYRDTPGSTATLSYYVTDSGATGRLHRMTADWLSGPGGGNNVTYNSFGQDDDWYRFTLDDGESATLALTAATFGDVSLELYDGGQNLLASGVEAANVGQIINNFLDATSDGTPDSYLVRATGDPTIQYSLVVTRGADFDTEANSNFDSAQEISGIGGALGHVTGETRGGVRSQRSGVRGQGSGVRSQRSGVSSGPWSLVPGPWSLPPDAWREPKASIPLPYTTGLKFEEVKALLAAGVAGRSGLALSARGNDDESLESRVQGKESGVLDAPRSTLRSLEGPIPLLQDFPGPDFTGFVPPDPIAAAGPEQVVTIVNTDFAIYDKATGAELFRQNMNYGDGFFGSVGATDVIFDPWVLFDTDTQRFFAIAIDIASSSQSNLFLAVSTDPTPTTGSDWYKYKIDFTHNPTGGLGSGAHFPDYPKMGVDEHAIYISGNYFPISVGDGVYAGITALEKASLLSGGAANVVYQEYFNAFSVFPMTQYGPAPAAYFAEANFFGGSTLTIHAVSDVLGSPTRSSATISVPPFEPADDVPQLGGGAGADAIDARVMTGVWREGSMWFGHPIEDPAIGDGEAVARWYEVATDGFPGGTPVLVQSGNVDPGPGVEAFMPAVAVDGNGNLGIGFSLGGPDMYFGAGFTGRLRSDPPGETVLPVSTLVEGQGHYDLSGGGRNRWGDYSGISVDPADDATFWVFNEYATDANTWATQVGAFQLEEPTNEDWYQFLADAGDTITLATSTPADGPGEFVNLLDPAIELIDPSGATVLTDDRPFGGGSFRTTTDGRAGDGHNARLVHVAPESGSYRARVIGVDESAGEYFLTLDLGASAAGNPAPEVIDTDPDNGQLVPTLPSSLTLHFSEAILLSTVDADDLLVGGLPALRPIIIDGRTVQFEVDPAVAAGDGVYRVELAADAVSDLQGVGNLAYSGTFQLDTTGPRVVATAWGGQPFPADGVLGEGPLRFEASFDEDLFVSASARRGLYAPGGDDILLYESVSGQSFQPTSVDYDPDTDVFAAQYDPLAEGFYTLTLISGDDAFEDVVGNDLDGEPLGGAADGTPSGDGSPGGNYSVDFSLDRESIEAVAFERLRPLGGLLAASRDNRGVINYAGDQDDFTLFAEAGQTIAAAVYPYLPSGGDWNNPPPNGRAATLSIELLNDVGVGLAGPISASSPGEPVVLRPVTVAAGGSYAIRVSGDAIGAFRLEIGLNLAVEGLDSGLGVSPRRGQATAGNPLPIDDSFVELDPSDPGNIGRYGVLGDGDPQAPDIEAMVWGVQPATGRIILIDPGSGDILYGFSAPDALSPADTQIGLSIAEGGDSLLYINSDVDSGSLYRLDPATGLVLSVETTDGRTYNGLGFEWGTVEGGVIYSAEMDADPGWTLQGGWAFGQPTGGGGFNGLDPTSGYTGSNVIGYNLSGDYPDNMPVYYATTPPIDASMYEDVALSLHRWLGVESSFFDHATVEVSNDGVNWTLIWENPTNSLYDGAWVPQSFDISAVADGQSTLYLRFGMGPTDGSVTFCGWNIDDVQLTGTLTRPPKIFLGFDRVEVRRQEGFSGPISSHLATVSPTGGVGGDDAGRQFAFAAGTGIVEYDPEVPNVILNTLPAPAADIEGLAFDGLGLYASTASGELFTLDPDTAEVLGVATVPGGGLFGLGAMSGARELIQNGSFETGELTGWTALSNGLEELTPWTVGPASDTPQLPVLITEAGTGEPDFAEIQNVTTGAVDTTGWVVVVNNADDRFPLIAPDINAYHATLWNLPDSIGPGEVLYRDDIDDGIGEFWGENIFWRTSGPGWVLLLDDEGNVVDFVVWGYGTDEIESFGIDIPGYGQITITDAWRGPAEPAAAGASMSLKRTGNADHDDAGDWAFSPEPSPGEQNDGFGTPFFGPAPLSGMYSAYNGFEGEAGLAYELYQDVSIPRVGNVVLSTNHRIEYAGDGTGVEPRVFEISVRNPNSGSLISTLYTEQLVVSGPPANLGWNNQVFDLSAFAGQRVRIHFSELIPESFTGASIIEFDQLSLTAGRERPLLLPDVDAYTLDLTGKRGRMIDVALARAVQLAASGTSSEADFSTSRLELIGPDGTTVLATAVGDPLGTQAENYELAILGFVVPADGVYTLRFASTVDAKYGIVITDSLVFDTEPNDELGEALRTLDDRDTALGYLSSGGTSGLTLTPIAPSDGSFPRGTAESSSGPAPARGKSRVESRESRTLEPRLSPFDPDQASSAFGWEAFNVMLAQFTLDAPEVLNNQGSQFNSLYSGDFDASGDFSVAYAIDSDTSTLVSMDMATGALRTIGPITSFGGENWTGMAADPTSGLMYASSTSVAASSLYTVDLTTGTASRIGEVTNSPGLIALAVDDTGVMYGHDIINDSLIRIDKETGAGTIVGSLGFDANFAQGMDFDSASGQLYLAAYNNSTATAELRIADRDTGATTLVGALGATSHGAPTEVCWLGVAAGGRVNLDTADRYEITLQAGETLLAYTETALGNSSNDLDPALGLYDPSAAQVATDGDSEDGKNARLIYTAPADGTYTIEVLAEGGTGEYLLKRETFAEVLPFLRLGDAEVAEGDRGTVEAVLSVSLSEDPPAPVSVRLDTIDSAAAVTDGDYQPISGRVLSFDPGGLLDRQVIVQVYGDTNIEPREAFFVRLTAAEGAILADRNGVVTILNDDTRISVAEGLQFLEGDRGLAPFALSISLAAAADVPVTVDYATADGTATVAELDYTPADGTLTFDPGQLEKTIALGVLADTQIEAHETFFVNFSNPSQPIDRSRSLATILNDDTEITIDDVSLAEGDTGTTRFDFTVSLAAPSAEEVLVLVETSDGTATEKDGDYRSLSELSLAFQPDEISQTVSVAVLGDRKGEGDETFMVNLMAATEPIARSRGIGTIENDDQFAAVVGRQIFYNNSYFDGNRPAAGEQDDNAIATDKEALLPGLSATFANYTSYSRGLNGIMVDLDHRGGNPTADDFLFRIGNNDDPSTWTAPPAPTSVTVRPGSGIGGSDRVTIIWDDLAIVNQWLQVTVLATANTGLPAGDVFYFGNTPGEAGDSTVNARVSIHDMLLARDNPRDFRDPATIDFPYDYNRDGRVNSYDLLTARDNQTHFLNALELITVPIAAGKKSLSSAPVSFNADAVFRQWADDEARMTKHEARSSSAVIGHSGFVDWVYEFEQSSKQQASEADNAADQLADQLLRAYWP